MKKLDKALRPEGASDIDWLPPKKEKDLSNRRQIWTMAEIDSVIRLRNAGKSISDIAKELRRTEPGVQLKISRMGLGDNSDEWDIEHLKLLWEMRSAGTLAIQRKLKELGSERTSLAIRKMLSKERAKREVFGDWQEAEAMSQPEFYKSMKVEFSQCTGNELTYKLLSEISFYSLSRIQKWFTPGSAQEPLIKSTRHHFWLLAKSWRIS